jgi:hypothetical protein
MGRVRKTDYEKKKFQEKKKEKPFVLPDPRCKQCDYWRYFGGIGYESIYCCHFALTEGKLRDRISETECGSFVDKDTVPKRKATYQTVPMSQWGCSGLGTIRKGER